MLTLYTNEWLNTQKNALFYKTGTIIPCNRVNTLIHGIGTPTNGYGLEEVLAVTVANNIVNVNYGQVRKTMLLV